MRVEKDFVEFCESLNATGTEYLIVGGFAVGHHGAPRYTQDMDFFVNPAGDHFQRLKQALRAFAGFELPSDWQDLGSRILEMVVPPLQFHVMASISGVEWDEAWASRSPGVYGPVAVNYLGRDMLLKNKVASNRDKDRADVRSLRRTDPPGRQS
jgi:hypothetical protein